MDYVPIKIPENPFWTVFKRFGRDELIAMFVNVISTAIIAFFTSNPLLISLTGPVVEKIGFFPGHFHDAWTIYKSTPKDKRKNLTYYFKCAMKNGSVSLIEDILVHDPIYVILMFLGLRIYSQTPAWLLATGSFIVAVLIVAILEVLVDEIRFLFLKKRFWLKGFGVEKYYEARFLVDKKDSPKKVISKISKAFNLDVAHDLKYSDTYFETSFPSVSSNRSVRVRFRNRTNEENKRVKSIQIVYTRASESLEDKYDQFRYFPIKKEKIYYVLEGEKPHHVKDIKNKKVRKMFTNKVFNEHRHVDFKRLVAHDNELLVSADKVKKNSFLLEIKVYNDKKLLRKAMRYVMKEFSLTQTTQGKSEIYSEEFYY